MTRETKFNSIFLIAIIAVSAPGFYYEFMKRVHGPNRPSFMAEPVATASAFNQPPPVPPSLPRLEPQLVRDWAIQLLRADAGPSASLLRTSAEPTAGPVMGDRFITQGLSLSRADGTITLRLLIWDAQPLTPASVHITGFAGTTPIDGQITEVTSIDVPPDVRHSLQDLHFIDPPQKVARVVCHFALSGDSPAIDRVQIDLPNKPTESLKLSGTTGLKQ